MTYKDFVNNMIMSNALPTWLKQGEDEGYPGFIYSIPSGEQYSIELRRDMDGFPVFWSRCGKNSMITQTLQAAETWLWGEILKQKGGGESIEKNKGTQ